MPQWLPYLLFLACPLSMGVMMWVMMAMMRGSGSVAPGRLRLPLKTPASPSYRAR